MKYFPYKLKKAIFYLQHLFAREKSQKKCQIPSG